jgi:hypothetical protein
MRQFAASRRADLPGQFVEGAEARGLIGELPVITASVSMRPIGSLWAKSFTAANACV